LKINCPRLAAFDIGNREAALRAFSDAPVMEMAQGWRDQPEEKFMPAQVRTGWRDDRMLVLAELDDDVIFTQATADNQLLCLHGDVFEIFLRDPVAGHYVEFHVAPNGKRLQLLYPDHLAIHEMNAGKLAFEKLTVTEPLFDFSLWIEERKWTVCASVPISTLLKNGGSLGGRTWLASFSRYDYSSFGEPPVHSSTSPHAELSFHRQQEWAEILFIDHVPTVATSRTPGCHISHA
jgi:hypothetical protein